jgi:hypothetical protein
MSKRFSAKLLFQFRVDLGESSGKLRTCEERIIMFTASSPTNAIAEAKKRGRAAKFSYSNDEGNPVHFEFVGVVDIIPHGPEMEPGVVWYDIRNRLLPKERRASIIPSDAKLVARASR